MQLQVRSRLELRRNITSLTNEYISVPHIGLITDAPTEHDICYARAVRRRACTLCKSVKRPRYAEREAPCRRLSYTHDSPCLEHVIMCDNQATQKAEDRMKITEDLVKEREMIISSLEAELTSYKNEVRAWRRGR